MCDEKCQTDGPFSLVKSSYWVLFSCTWHYLPLLGDSAMDETSQQVPWEVALHANERGKRGALLSREGKKSSVGYLYILR